MKARSFGIFAAGLVPLLLTAPAFAAKTEFTKEQALIAMGLCTEMVQRINIIVDYSETKCIPSLATTGTNFIFVTEKPLFLIETSRKAWMLVVVAAVGKALSDNSSYHADKIFVADVDMAKEKKFYVMSATLAVHLQRDVFVGKITGEEMWSQISAALRPYLLPDK
jgi:hypothetical protein